MYNIVFFAYKKKFSRIIDVFLSEGIEIIFKVALALLQLGKDDLLCLDMEGMLRVSNLYYIIYNNYNKLYSIYFLFF